MLGTISPTTISFIAQNTKIRVLYKFYFSNNHQIKQIKRFEVNFKLESSYLLFNN